jgi:hypothetical protein
MVLNHEQFVREKNANNLFLFTPHHNNFECTYCVGLRFYLGRRENFLDLLWSTEEGKDAEIIGEATAHFKGVAMQTVVGGERIVARPVGDPVPRIC